MVDRLGDALGVPLRERNRMLELAGLAGVYPEDDASDRFFQKVARPRHSAAVTGSRATPLVDDAPSRAAPRA